MSLEQPTDQIPESQEVQEHRRSQAERPSAIPSDADLQGAIERFADPQFDDVIKEEDPVDLDQAVQHFDNDAYDLAGELVDDGLIRSKARRGVQEEARANTKTKLKKAAALATTVVTLAGVGHMSGVNQDIVSGAGDQISAFGGGLKDVVIGDSDPLANYTGRDSDKNTIAGKSGNNVTEPQSKPVYQGVHLNEGPAVTEGQSLPVSPEDREFAEKMAEQNEQAEQRAAEVLDQETGGARFVPPSGGAPAQTQ